MARSIHDHDVITYIVHFTDLTARVYPRANGQPGEDASAAEKASYAIVEHMTEYFWGRRSLDDLMAALMDERCDHLAIARSMRDRVQLFEESKLHAHGRDYDGWHAAADDAESAAEVYGTVIAELLRICLSGTVSGRA